jgi:hypothetical protein
VFIEAVQYRGENQRVRSSRFLLSARWDQQVDFAHPDDDTRANRKRRVTPSPNAIHGRRAVAHRRY